MNENKQPKDKMNSPVLILGTDPRIALPVARSLHRHGIRVTVAALSPETPKLSSRAVENFVRLPSGTHSPNAFIESISSLIRQEQFDTLIPIGDTPLTLVAQHYEPLRLMLRVSCPPPYILQRVLDKRLTLETADRCGIAIPATYYDSDLSQLEALKNQLTFPMIGKPRSKSWVGMNDPKICYFQNFDGLREALGSDPQFGERILLQEYCSGEGVGIGMLIHQGEPVAAFQHRRLKELPSTGGVSVKAISEVLDAKLKDAALKLLRALEWDGIAMVEFRVNRTKQTAVLMEVNGRYWGTCSLAIQAGIDFPYYEWLLAHGERPKVPSSYEIGAQWRWTVGCLQRLHGLFTDSRKDQMPRPSRWAELLTSWMDFRPSVRSAVWSISDPVPAILELRHAILELVALDAKSLVKKVLPQAISDHVRVYNQLGPQDRASYLKLQLLRALRMRRDNLRRLPASTIRSILFVCHGNIIRSPMAAALLRQLFLNSDGQTISISSAGLHAKPGHDVDPRALESAREFGISLDNHRSQPLTQELVAQADAIFVMDYINEAMLLARYPKARRKVLLLNINAERNGPRQIEIVDPYEGDESSIRGCYEDLELRIRELAYLLSSDKRH